MKKIKSKASFNCIYENGKLSEEILAQTETFDEDQNLIKIQRFSAEGSLTQEDTFIYEAGLLIKSIEEDKIDGFIQNSVFEYNNDLLSVQRDYYNETDFLETRYSYDAENRMTSLEKHDDESNFMGKVLFDYSEDWTIEEEYNEENILVHVKETRLDAFGNTAELIQKEIYNGEDVFNEVRKLYGFKAKDELLDYKAYKDNQLLFESQLEYNEEGLQAKSSSSNLMDGTNQEQRYHYNEKNELIKLEVYNNDFPSSYQTYEYDEFGETQVETAFDIIDDEAVPSFAQKYKVEYF